jgi:predicted HAD superfamily phosphohydrolase YqeG
MKNIITVHRPQLTDEEREWRMKQIKEAAARLVIANEERKVQSHEH